MIVSPPSPPWQDPQMAAHVKGQSIPDGHKAFCHARARARAVTIVVVILFLMLLFSGSVMARFPMINVA